MIGRVVSWGVSFIGLAAVIYVYFAVPLGELTLHEHMKAIVATDAAQNLGREAGVAAARVKTAASDGAKSVSTTATEAAKSATTQAKHLATKVTDQVDAP